MANMKEGDIITGKLAGFTYVGQDVKYCKITVEAGDATHKTLLGTSEVYPFSAMLSLKGAGAQVRMMYDGDNEYGARFKDVEFVL